jgi:hypothetical protein
MKHDEGATPKFGFCSRPRYGAWRGRDRRANYRGFRFEVDAVPERDRFNAAVRIRRHGVQEDPHVALVNCWKQTVMAAERAGALWARRWIDSRLYSE